MTDENVGSTVDGKTTPTYGHRRAADDEETTTVVVAQPAASSTTDDGLNGAPWWAKLSARFGIPAAIAIGLTWFLTQGVSGDLKTIRDNTRDATAAIVAQKTSMDEQHQSIVKAIELDSQSRGEILRFLQRICVNTAKTDADRSNCIR